MSDISEKLVAYDAMLREKHGPVLLGIDEAGRGALAGPISAGAVILPPKAHLPGLNDSKKMTMEMRSALEPQIKAMALGWGFALIWPKEIDERGLTWANGEAMRLAAEQAMAMANGITVDLYVLDQFNQRQISPVQDLAPFVMASKMDGTSLCVAAASVIAKSGRDSLMAGELNTKYPEYNFVVNKGYISPDHVAAVRAHGRKKGLHRMTYQVEGVNKPRQFGLTDLLGEEEINGTGKD